MHAACPAMARWFSSVAGGRLTASDDVQSQCLFTKAGFLLLSRISTGIMQAQPDWTLIGPPPFRLMHLTQRVTWPDRIRLRLRIADPHAT